MPVLVRRLLIFAALLLGLAVLAASVAPREEAATRVGPAPTAAPPPSSAGVPDEPELSGREPASEADVPGEPPLRRLDAGGSGQEVRARIGERVRLAIFSDELATVQVGEDGPIEAIDPDAPARFSLLYDAATELPIRVLESGRTIGVLRIVD